MVVLLDGNPEHVAQVWKTVFFPKYITDLGLLSI